MNKYYNDKTWGWWLFSVMVMMLLISLVSCRPIEKRQEVKSDGTQIIHDSTVIEEKEYHNYLNSIKEENKDDLEVIHTGYLWDGIYRLKTDSASYIIVRESSNIAIIKE